VKFGAVAERYARAIFELGVEANRLEELTAELQRFAEAYAHSPELRAVLDNPLVDLESRAAVLDEIAARLQLSELAQNAIRLLSSRQRLVAIGDIVRRLGTLSDEQAGILRATVTSAVPLSELYYGQLLAEIERATGRKVVIERREDPTLIAGVVTRIGDNTIDGSVKGRLAELQRRLSQP
jgi:F-type H+-transporting ATPase subunit delta